MQTTDTILDKIVASKKLALIERKQQRSKSQLESALKDFGGQASDFYSAFKSSRPQFKIIGEIKKTSPSTNGAFHNAFSVGDVVKAYQNAPNIVAISVITEADHFQGSEATLAYASTHNPKRKALLRKDFIFDQYQIMETKLLGAHAYLLIASLFNETELQALISFGQSLSLEPLVEVHTKAELNIVRRTTARCIGVNSRNLKTFTIDRNAHELLRELDDSYVRIAESGINSAERLRYVSEFADAALIGSYFMQAEDIAATINSLVKQKVT